MRPAQYPPLSTLRERLLVDLERLSPVNRTDQVLEVLLALVDAHAARTGAIVAAVVACGVITSVERAFSELRAVSPNAATHRRIAALLEHLEGFLESDENPLVRFSVRASVEMFHSLAFADAVAGTLCSELKELEGELASETLAHAASLLRPGDAALAALLGQDRTANDAAEAAE